MQYSLPVIAYRLALLITLFSYPLVSSASDKDRIYTVGVVPQFEPIRISETWRPLLNKISETSGIPLRLKSSPSIPEFEKQFENGEFDFAYMNPYHLVVANKKTGYLPLLRDVYRDLRGIIVVRKDSPLTSVKELDGKTLAFPAPNSLGAALIPRSEFSRKFQIKVNEMYVKSHSSVYLNVLLGQADAGGGVETTLAQQAEEIRDKLRILYKTSTIPSHPFTAHPRVDNNTQQKIILAFLELEKSEAGKQLLMKVPIQKIGTTSLSEYEHLNKMGLDKFYIRK